MSQRRKGACTIAALAVGFGCAVFGVGGADGGTRAYARHVREARVEARLAGLALDRRSPEQLVLAIRPKTSAAHTAAASTAVTQAPVATSAATTSTSPAAPTSTTPAATTTSTTSTTPSDSTPSNASAAEGAGESIAPSNPVGTVTTTTGTTTTGTTTTGTTTTGTTTTGTTTTGTTTTGTTTTGTTTTGTATTGTTTTGATTTGTTTTGTTTTGTTTTGTTTTGTATNASTTVNGRDPSGATTSTVTGCHGRCEGLTGNSGAVPATLPSTTSSSTSNNFSFTETSVPAVTPAASTTSSAVNDASTGTLNPTATPTTPASTTPTSSGNSTSSTAPISLDPIKLSATSAINRLATNTSSHRSGASLPTTASGTGTVPAGGGTGTGPAGGAGAGTVAAAGTTAAARRSGLTRRADRHPSSGSSALTAPFNSSVQVIDHIVNVIPTGVWVALGAAFTLMLAFAGVALRSSRRARRREKEFAAISAAALTDALTGILNRRGFTEAAERELARASRYERPFVLAYVDVRGLKAVNDTEGHLMGDELIKAVAGLMKESARADDVVGRIGGDEFALLLGEQTAESAEPVIRRIRARVAEARAEMEISVPWELTIGVASFPGDGATLEELLDLADRRLYEQRGIALR
jgi:diguanylate cyclase (GGDEF)-like protein